MKILSFAISAAAALTLSVSAFAAVENPQSVKDLLNRIGGPGTDAKFITVVDDAYKSPSGAEMFKIAARDGKPCITGTTLSAVTTGLGWYLNHTANVNYAWNSPSVDLSSVPAPQGTEEHTTSAAYRYYLNYCTFSYSMSTWTWDRWQEEIDWMALHGINMPLQIIGLEEVWRRLLVEDYGYTKDEANAFVGGPCFMAWFGMNNLEGHGGPNPDWWYTRQAELGKKITARMHELGIEPVLPGFAGMVPSNFTSKTGIAASGQGGWCGFTRPYIVDSTGDRFSEVAQNYYKRLKEVMGESQYYSIDPYHEGGTAPANPGLGYQKMFAEMEKAKPGSQWVIQSWQWSGAQRTCLDNIEKGRLIVLDLYSDGNPGWGNYKGHDTVYSTIFNFGGRTGFFGRFNGIIDGYFKFKDQCNAGTKGIGAAPEAIEQTPVMYDLLFELPWMETKPDPAEWMAGYAKRRYSADSPEAAEAWELLRNSALNCTTGLQGPHEAIVCARPSLTVNSVSTWGGSGIFYNRTDMVNAAYGLLNANLSGNNYSYDLADIARQALTDYSKSLLAGIKEANDRGDTETFGKRRDAFLELILDLDRLLMTNKMLTLGNWTERARAMADEVSGTTAADRDWLELNNARTIITTWGPKASANGGGLHDYSYREWGGSMKDFYYQRWKIWFDNGMKAPNNDWFSWEWNWAHSNPDAYSSQTVGDTRTVASELLPKYLTALTSKLDGQAPAYVDRLLTNDLRTTFFDRAEPESVYTPSFANGTVAEIAIDFSKNGRFDDGEVQTGGSFTMGADVPVGERMCRVTLTDGTQVTYTVKILVNITEPRTVSVATANAEQGSVKIDGTDALSVTGTDYVKLHATAAELYDFDHWEDAAGNNIGNDNPMTYYGKEDARFTAHFVINKWGVPEGNNYADRNTIASYKQYVKSMSYTQNGESTEFYSTDSEPDRQFVQVPTRIKAAPGGEFSFNWSDAGGLRWLFLSAYADLNSDGTFEMDRNGELLGTYGQFQNDNNPAVAAGEFKVLLPYDTKLGTTHIRLRFDSAWGPTESWNSELKCFRADGKTNRFVYEILLDVVESPEYACTVTYSSNNAAFGSMRSENETMVYNPGEEVILTAFPKEGCRVKRWIDNHGRELPADWIAEDGLSVRFKAFDNAEITAEFELKPIEASGFVFNAEIKNDGTLHLTEITSDVNAEHHLDLSQINNLGSVAPTLFAGNKDIYEVTLPANKLTAQGAEIHSANITGAGTHNFITRLDKTIAGTDAWTMVIKGNTTDRAYNGYGSALWGNGTDALAGSFGAGWSQIYLRNTNRLCIKWGNNNEHNFDLDLTGNFTIYSEFDGNRTLQVTITNAAGQSESKTIVTPNQMHDISQYACCIPQGMNLQVGFYQPDTEQLPGELFRGCPVEQFNLAEGNTVYKEVDGVIYNAAKSAVVAYPEGRLFSRGHIIKANGKTLTASPAKAGNEFAALEIARVDAPANHAAALWQLAEVNGKQQLTHLNSGLAITADASGIHPSNTGKFDYALEYAAAGFPKLALANDLKFDFEQQDAITITAPMKSFTLTLPVTVEAPEGLSLWAMIVNSKGQLEQEPIASRVIAAGTPVLIGGATAGGQLKFTTVSNAATALADETSNLLRGTCVDLTDAENFYTLGADNRFRLNTSGTIPANTAYLLKSDLPEGTGDEFATAIKGLEAAESDADLRLFDLQGRAVSNRSLRPGIYIDARGNKTLIR